LPGRNKSGRLTVALNLNRPPSQAEILPTHTAALFRAAVTRAAELLRAGEVVALPTETVYGLAANALDARAVARIFEAKGRPAHNPVIVHVASREMARECVAAWPSLADTLARSFWPGPLTLVLPRSEKIPDAVTAGGPTVGVRWPAHPFIQAVILECGFPLAAPSANLSNAVSPTNAAHVNAALGGKIRLIVDGGQSQVGIESTVLDLTANPPRILRPGMIHAGALRAAAEGEWRGGDCGSGREAGALRSPGLLPRHYSPRAKLEILSWRDDEDLRAQVQELKSKINRVHVIAHTVIPAGLEPGRVSVIPHDAEAFARAIYAELHQCDEAGAERIIVEAVPDTLEWRAIADRLRRAAA
jgi:L-threonylcarbamoyladenylate synthase